MRWCTGCCGGAGGDGSVDQVRHRNAARPCVRILHVQVDLSSRAAHDRICRGLACDLGSRPCTENAGRHGPTASIVRSRTPDAAKRGGDCVTRTLLLGAALALTACSASLLEVDVLQNDADGLRSLEVASGTGFGMCAGYCVTELRV